MLDAVSQAVIVTDLEGRITHWNSYAERVYGWRRDEVVGRLIVDVTPSRAKTAEAEEIMEQLRKGGSWAGPFVVRRRDCAEFDAFVILAPLIDGGKMTGIIGISTPLDGAPDADFRQLLTPRECEVARFTASGKTSAQIARILGITQRTVESHRANLYRKLGIRSRTELIFRSLRKLQPLSNDTNTES